MSRKSIDYALLMALGLSAESAEIVMDEIDMLRAAVLNENAHLEQMTMAANQLHADLAEATAANLRWFAKSSAQSVVIAAARESCSSTLIFLGGQATEDDHWRASQSADALRMALQSFDAEALK